MRFQRLVCLSAVGFGAVAMALQPLVVARGDQGQAPVEYYRDFCADGFDNRSLKPFGRGATSLVKETKAGIEVFVPDRSDVKLVGLAPRFKVQGDFEITVGYKVLEWTRPKRGSGIGPSIYIASIGDAKSAAELGRLHGDKRDIFSAFSAFNVEGERRKIARRFPAHAQEGRLRLRRRGEVLAFEVADGPADTSFRLISQTKYGTEDLRLVRIAVKQSNPQSSAKVAIQDLRIRADALPQSPTSLAPEEKLYSPTYHEPPPSNSDWSILWWATGGPLVFLVGGVFMWRKRRSV